MTALRAQALPFAALALALLGGSARASDTPPPALGDLRAVGSVVLRTSCGPEAQAGIERATALLHSFFYEEARRVYEAVAAKAPDCAIAHWGVAMTYWHPIWTPPTPSLVRPSFLAPELSVSRPIGPVSEAACFQEQTSFSPDQILPPPAESESASTL